MFDFGSPSICCENFAWDSGFSACLGSLMLLVAGTLPWAKRLWFCYPNWFSEFLFLENTRILQLRWEKSSTRLEPRCSFWVGAKILSSLSCVTFLGGSITTFGDIGRLGPDYWATEFVQPAVLSRLCLDPTFSKSSACDRDALELLFVNSISMRFCYSSASAFFLSFLISRSCCRKRSSSSCCCNFRRNSCSRCCCSCYFCIRNSSCWRQSSLSSRSFSISNCRSRSCCSASFLVLMFWSSISSICRLLDDRKLAILGFFLLSCVAECLDETSTFFSGFSIAPIFVLITVLFESLLPADVDETNGV